MVVEPRGQDRRQQMAERCGAAERGGSGRAPPRRSLGGEAFGCECLVRRRLPGIRRRRGSFFLDLGEQPGLHRGGCPLSLRIVMGEAAGLEDYGTQLGGAAAVSVVEVHKRQAGPGHRILQERGRRCRRQAMHAAQMQKSADKAMAAISVIVTAACPVAVVGKKLEHEIEQLHGFCDFRLGHWFDRFRSGGDELSLSPGGAIRIGARSRQNDRLDQTQVVVIDVAAARLRERHRQHAPWVSGGPELFF